MVKLLKIIGKTGAILLEWLLIFLIILSFAIRTSPVQTYFAQLATNYLSKQLNTTISIDKVSIIFIDKVELEGVLLLDQAGDTIFAAASVYTEISDYNFKNQFFKLSDTEVKNARIAIARSPEGEYNYQFIQDYFSSDKKSSKRPTILFENIEVFDTQFSYDDNRKERKDYGVDYFHIYTANIHTIVKDFLIEGREYSGKIVTLQCDEKSGFKLNDLQTGVYVDSSGVYLDNILIQSPGSRVASRQFNMLASGFTDFREFVDSVKFDAIIDESSVALTEGSLFAPILKGMNDTIVLSTKMKKKAINLRLSDFNLRIKDKTAIRGTFNIPDYRKFDKGFFHEKIDYAYIDVDELKNIRMPDASGIEYLEMNERVERLRFFDIKNARLDGFYSQFVVASNKIRTGLGDIYMDNGIMFTENSKNGSLLFEESSAGDYDVKISEFQLGKFLADPNLGQIDGVFFLSGEAYSISDIRFHSIKGNVNRIDYLDYPYHGVEILEGRIEDDVFYGKIDVRDDNLEMTYDGMVDYRNELHLLFGVEIKRAALDKLKFTSAQRELSSNFTIDLRGRNPNDFRGSIHMSQFKLVQGTKFVEIPSMELNILRSPEMDEFFLTSDLASGYLKGKMDINYIMEDLQIEFSRVFPALFEGGIQERNPKKMDHFDFHFEVKNADDFMFIVYPDAKIAPNTTVDGHFYAENYDLSFQLVSGKVEYNGIKFKTINLDQTINRNQIYTNYTIDQLTFGDTLDFNNVLLKTMGNDNKLNSELSWEYKPVQQSLIAWETNVNSPENIDITLDPSSFYLLDKKWDIIHASNLTIRGDTIEVGKFDLTRNEQLIHLEGLLSSNPVDHLNFDIREFKLEEISSFISSVPLEGTLNSWGYIANPYRGLQFSGSADILQFKTKGQLVGDINLKAEWVPANQSIAVQGDLMYKGNQTFDFIGDYYINRKKDNLDFDLFFEYTDIQFTNAFMDEDVLSEIHGLLNGTIKVTGSLDEPILNGGINLLGGSVKTELLGTHFGVEGMITADQDGFYINGIPVYDEDGNAGLLIGSIYHDNFQNFNFDLMFDLEDDALNKDPNKPWLVQPLDKFLILNSQYKPGDIYYGTGYGRGFVDIFGYTDNLEITVDLETRKGTKINIPMYGVGDIDEEDFIVFIDKDTTIEINNPKLDFTGVDLNLHFRVTKDAELKIIFDENLGDEITAHGKGDIDIALNNIGDVTMKGVYTVNDGVYNFAMGIIKEKFYIKEGGSISWTGDPYDAILNLRTYYKVNANIAAATNTQFASSSAAHEDIFCYLDITESIYKPTIKFDLEAPNAKEEAKSVITRIKSDPDELNRQFFSLILWKRFQPLSGGAYASGNTAFDLVTNQINAVLSTISDDYKMNVNMNSDNLTGDNTYEFGVTKGFLNDRLILSGSFGVENRKNVEAGQESSIIGDINLEYLLNESGTFRVNIFNASNDKSIIQSEDQGSFTQGAGLYYKEDFHTIKDFKAIQYFLDIFRKKGKKRYPIKRKRKQTPVPKEVLKQNGILPEETN